METTTRERLDKIVNELLVAEAVYMMRRFDNTGLLNKSSVCAVHRHEWCTEVQTCVCKCHLEA